MISSCMNISASLVLSIIIPSLSLLMSCSSFRDSNRLASQAQQDIGTVTDTQQSPDSRYILYLNKDDGTNAPDFTVSFVIYDKQDQQKVYQDTLANTDVSWQNETQLLLRQQLGILTKNGQGYKDYILDVATGRKYEKSSQNQ